MSLDPPQDHRPAPGRDLLGLGARPETAVRGGGGAVSASIRRRRAGCLHRPPPAAPHRRCDGAPASPLRYSARARTARLSPARGGQAGDGLSSPHLPRRDEGARGMGSRVRGLQPAAAGGIRSRVRLPRAGEAAPAARGAEYAAGRRGHPRSAYEAPRAAVDRSTRFIGAESKRRGCPRLPARQSRGTLLARPPLRPAPAGGTGSRRRRRGPIPSRTFITPRNMKRRKPIACLLSACRRQTCGTHAGPNSAAGRRGRRRSAYEAPRAAADGGTRFGGAESKRRRRPRLPAPPSRVTLLGRLRRPAATAPRLGAGRAARTAAPAPPPAALRGPGPADAAQEIPDLLAEFLAHELPNRGHEALLSWHPVPSRLRFGCSYSNAPSRARRARWLRGEVFPLQMERIRFHEFQSSRALPHFQNSFEWTDDISRYTVNVLVQRREWLGAVRFGMH